MLLHDCVRAQPASESTKSGQGKRACPTPMSQAASCDRLGYVIRSGTLCPATRQEAVDDPMQPPVLNEQIESAGPDRSTWGIRNRGLMILAGALVVHIALLYLAGILDFRRVRIAGADPVGYYAYLRSGFFDHDLEFRNEYTALHGIGFASPDQPLTPTGKLPNPYAVGCAVMWFPFFLGAHFCTALSGAAADGYSQPYHTAIYLANVVYGLGALVLAYRLARRYFSEQAAVTGTVTVWLCTNFFYYLFPLVPMSHTTSMFVVTIVLWLWATGDGPAGPVRATAIGAFGGLAALIRWQNALFMLIPAGEMLVAVGRDRLRGRQLVETIVRLATMCLVFLTVFLPQMIVWHSLYGRWLTVPQGSEYVVWYKPHLFDVLFSTRHGLISWTPAVAGCLLGIVMLVRTRRRLAAGLLAAFLLQLYVNSVAGWTGWSFGMRRFVNCTALFVLGAAYLIEITQQHRLRPYLVGGTIVLAVWNVLFAFQYYFGLVPRDDYLTFTQFVTDKFRLLPVLIFGLARGG